MSAVHKRIILEAVQKRLDEARQLLAELGDADRMIIEMIDLAELAMAQSMEAEPVRPARRGRPHLMLVS